MARTVATIPLLLALAAPSAAHAQATNRFYLGSAVGVDGGSRGDIPSGRVPSVSALAGVRIAGGWSAELEAERAFRETSRSAEAVWTSLAPPNASREEIERLGIRARFDRSDRAGPGVTALATWRTRAPGRMNGGLSVGVSTRQFKARVVRTVTAVPPGYSIDDPRWPNEDSTRHRTGTGLTLGGMLIASLTEHINLAPEVRFTSGFIGDDPYRVFKAGVRLLWNP